MATRTRKAAKVSARPYGHNAQTWAAEHGRPLLEAVTAWRLEGNTATEDTVRKQFGLTRTAARRIMRRLPQVAVAREVVTEAPTIATAEGVVIAQTRRVDLVPEDDAVSVAEGMEAASQIEALAAQVAELQAQIREMTLGAWNESRTSETAAICPF